MNPISLTNLLPIPDFADPGINNYLTTLRRVLEEIEGNQGDTNVYNTLESLGIAFYSAEIDLTSATTTTLGTVPTGQRLLSLGSYAMITDVDGSSGLTTATVKIENGSTVLRSAVVVGGSTTVGNLYVLGGGTANNTPLNDAGDVVLTVTVAATCPTLKMVIGVLGLLMSSSPDGFQGANLLSGTGDPTSDDGEDGDFWINTSTWQIFGPKASGSWPTGVDMIGADGTPGATDHGALTGLTDDDHSQYVHKTGRSGTQTISLSSTVGAGAEIYSNSSDPDGSLLILDATEFDLYSNYLNGGPRIRGYSGGFAWYYDGASVSMVITSANLVGIGTGSPGSKLELQETKTLSAGASDGYAAALTLDPGYTGAFTVDRHNYLRLENVSTAGSAVVTDACALQFDAAAGTHKALDGASGTDVDAWLKLNVNGTIYFVPVVASKSSLVYTDEKVDDRINGLLAFADGITKSYDDGANTYTISLGSITPDLITVTATAESVIKRAVSGTSNVLMLKNNQTTGATSDSTVLRFAATDDGGTQTLLSNITAIMTSATAGAVASAISISTLSGSVNTARLRVNAATSINSSLPLGINLAALTTTPARNLEVLDASNPQIRATHTAGSVYADIKCKSDGDVDIISPTGSQLLFNGSPISGSGGVNQAFVHFWNF